MPELPEVETVRRGLLPALDGAVIDTVLLRRMSLRNPIPEDLPQRLSGAEIIALRRRSKYILMDTDRDDTVLLHLGMSGQVRIYRPDETVPAHGAHDHVELTTKAGFLVRYRDPRRFGVLTMFPTASESDHKMLRDLGPEPLGNDFSEYHLLEKLTKRRSPVKTILLDQKMVAGLGNIYVCEVLWRAGVSPVRLGVDTNAEQVAKIYPAIRQVLEAAIKAGGSSLKDHHSVTGELGYFQHSFDVYGREGEACHRVGCGGTIARLVQSGRSSFYCPECQE